MALPYAFTFAPHSKQGKKIREYVIMPYAFGLEDNGMPDAEARARLDRALELARDIECLTSQNVIIFLGAGMEDRTRLKGSESLAASSKAYLESKGWSADQIRCNAFGYDTVTETLSFYGYADGSDRIVYAVTSWWHKPRVWAVCRIIFGRRIKVYASPSGHSGFRLVRDIVREIPALPRSVFMAWRAGKQCA